MPLPSSAAATHRDAIVALVLRRAEAHGGTLLVAPPGFGKTRVLAEVSDALQRRGGRVVRLIGTASGASVPFGLFLRLLDPDRARAVAAADPLGRAVLIRAAVLDLDLAALVIDEVTAIDPGSAAFVLELAQSGVAVVASLTEGRRVPDAVAALGRTGLASTVALPPLTVAESGELVRALLKAPVDSAALIMLRAAAEGSPAVLRELVREAVGSGALQRSGELWRLTGDLPAPRALRRRVEERFDAASPATRRWVAAVAVAEQLSVHLAEALVEAAVADEAERDGWTEYDAETRLYRIPQQVTRAAVLGRLGTRERRTALRALIDAAGTTKRPLTSIERTAVGGWRLELGDALEVDEALHLATMTSLAAPDLCERLLREAVANGGGARAEVALAEHMKRTGHIDEAEALLGAARSQTQDSRTVDQIALLLAIVTGIGARRSAHALAVLDAHLAAHAPTPDLLAVRSALLMREGRLTEALELAQGLAADREETFAGVFAGIQEVLLRGMLGEGDRAARLVDELREPAARTTDRVPEGPVSLDWLSGWVPTTVGLDVRTGSAVAMRNHDRMIELGMHAARTQFAHLLALCRTLEGDPVTAVQLLREAEGSPGIWRDSWLPTILSGLVEALALSGDREGARAVLGRLRALARTAVHETRVLLAEAELLAAEDDRLGAADLARAAARAAHERGAVVDEFDALAAGMRHGDDDAAAELAAFGPAPAGHGRDLQRAHARAVVADDVHLLDDAARHYWAAGLRLHAVAAAAQELQRSADRRTPVEQVAVAERLALWSLQVPSLVLGSTAKAVTGLTEREREVVRLAAIGLPDRGIASELGISVRTAQTHLGRAFTKLGIHRRADLRPLLQ